MDTVSFSPLPIIIIIITMVPCQGRELKHKNLVSNKLIWIMFPLQKENEADKLSIIDPCQSKKLMLEM